MTNNFSYSIVTGIISGVIVSVFTYIFYRIVRDIIKPWYARMVYKGVDVSGTWIGGFKRNSGYEVKVVFNIKQDSFDVRGVFFAETLAIEPQNKYSNQYKFLGQVINNVVIIHYEAMSNKRTGVGTMMLKVANGGSSLVGKLIHSEDVNNMWVDEFRLKRD